MSQRPVTRFAIIDTNVVVSGLLSGNADSPTSRVVDAMLAGTSPFVLSEALLVEYREVLLRPAITERHGLTETQVDTFLEGIVLTASIREPACAGRSIARVETACPGPAGDEHLIALLAAVPEALLVTGDRLLAEALTSWCSVVTPTEFAAALQDRAG